MMAITIRWPMADARRVAFWVWLVTFIYSPPVMGQPSLLPELTARRALYGTPMSPEEIGDLLTQTAASQQGWALLRKDAGARCPAMGTFVACDYLVHISSGQGFDVLTDWEGAAKPVWNRGDSFTPDRLVYVYQPQAPPTVPNPGTSVPVTGTDVGPIVAQLEALKADQQALLALLGEHDAKIHAGIDSLRMQIATIKFPDPPPSGPAIPPLEVSPDGGISAGSVLKWMAAIGGSAVATCVSTKCWK